MPTLYRLLEIYVNQKVTILDVFLLNEYGMALPNELISDPQKEGFYEKRYNAF